MASSSTMVYVPVSHRHKGFSKPNIVVGYYTPKRCLVLIAAAMVVGTVVIQCLLSFRHAFSDMHLRTDIDGELVIVSHHIATKYGATCLDGTSSPGYYVKRGIDEGEKRWLIVIPHSVWCNSLTDCYASMNVALRGTMNGAPVTHQFSGILSSDPAENEYFTDWNMIRLISCDGSSFLGNLSTSVPEQGRELKLRGAAVLAAIIEHIISSTDISNSKELVLYGEGSGAVSALAYTSYIRRMLPYIAKFTTVLHSGVLFNVNNSKYDINAFFELHNIKGNGLLSNCQTTSCLNADQLLVSPRKTQVILFTTGVPLWPLHIMNGCDNEEQCKNRGYASKYFENIIKLHSPKKAIKKLVTILSNCDWPLKTTVTNDDPQIDNQSIYGILMKGLSSPLPTSIYIYKGECRVVGGVGSI